MEVLYWRSDGQLIFELYRGSKQQIISSFKVLSHRWNHVAVTRQADIVRLFINGRLSGQQTIQNGFISNRNLRIGNDYEGNTFIGYMNELRLTKNVPRYVDNFISSIVKFDTTDPHFSNVSLLLHFEGNLFQNTFIDSSSSPKTIVRTGSIFIDQKESIFGTTSAFFSGRGSIENIRIYNKGYNYNKIPSLIINSEHGTGAVLSAQSNSIGQIKTIETINPFIDTDKNLVSVSIETDTGTGAIVNPIRSTVFKEKLNFKSYEGFLGLNATLLDSYYFQQFSYQTECELSRNQFDSIVDKFVHPVGFIRFSLLKIYDHKKIEISLNSDQLYSVGFYETGSYFIGYYENQSFVILGEFETEEDAQAFRDSVIQNYPLIPTPSIETEIFIIEEEFYSEDDAINHIFENSNIEKTLEINVYNIPQPEIEIEIEIKPVILSTNNYLFNPIFNLHWLKEIIYYTNWVDGFDWIREEETYEDTVYLSDAIPSRYIIYMVFFDENMIVNTSPNFEWFKNSELFDFSNEYWEDLSPEEIQNLNYLNEALDASVSLVV